MTKIVAICMGLGVMAGCAASVADRAVKLAAWEGGYQAPAGDRMAKPLAALKARLAEGGVEILEAEIDPYGLTYAAQKRIVLQAGLAPDAQFEVLAHEAGHFFHSPASSISEREVFAELVGVGIQEYYGSKTARESAGQYLTIHKTGFASLRYVQRDIDRAVKILTSRAPWPAEWSERTP